MKCENCGREPEWFPTGPKSGHSEPFWTSRSTGKPLTVCAECLFTLDGTDKRGMSVGQSLDELAKKREGAVWKNT